MNKITIDQFVEHTVVAKSNGSDIDRNETLVKERKYWTDEKHDGKRSQREDFIYQDTDENSEYKEANQENNQNVYLDGKVQNYASINLTVPEPYQALRNFFPQNQVNEKESGNKSNSDHYVPLTEVIENSYEHLPKTDSHN